MSAFQYNGGSVVAMAGKGNSIFTYWISLTSIGCVCIASDNRYGQQLHTISTEFPKIFKITDKIYLGLSGLATDIQVGVCLCRLSQVYFLDNPGQNQIPFEHVQAARGA